MNHALYCCGKVRKLAPTERIIDCNCGNRMDRDINSAINIIIVILLKSENGDHDFLLPNPPVNGESFLDRFPKATERFAAIHGLARGRSSDALAVSSSHWCGLEAPAFRRGLVHWSIL
ncbi:transposase [Candidatus Bathyarchaeota archaeon]|nr:transposase [Candidatus Bathyarchaeota archaeon]